MLSLKEVKMLSWVALVFIVSNFAIGYVFAATM